MIDPLSRLAILYGTDKFGLHDYTPNYHRLLRHLRKEPIAMLEIGVGGYADPKAGGRSLEVWRDYFPQGRIIGIDIAAKSLDLGPRVTLAQGSQVDPAFLEDLVTQHGPFDIILDDGSHRNEHVVES
ncbi:MAG: class I SAM-dependent methyltransferase, partial [Pseudomonadota bacterium]